VFDATTPTSYSSSAASGSGSGSGSGTGTAVAPEGPSSPLSDHLNGQVGIGNGNSNGNGEERNETEWERDVKYFEECIEALYSLAQEEQTETNPSAPVVPPKVWVLVNKMDIVGDGVASKKIKVFEEKRDEIERRCGAVGKRFGMDVGRGRGVRCFGTSIWDESLYKVGRCEPSGDDLQMADRGMSLRLIVPALFEQAWSSVIHNLIPNAALINSHLTHLRNISSCLEAVLFERQTFLVLAKSGSGLDADPDLDPGASTGTNKTLGNTGSAEDEEKNKVKAKAVMMDVEGLDEVEIDNGARGLERKRFEKISEVVKGFRRTCQ
jgi:Ras-related GTP-binding protein A/B